MYSLTDSLANGPPELDVNRNMSVITARVSFSFRAKYFYSNHLVVRYLLDRDHPSDELVTNRLKILDVVQLAPSLSIHFLFRRRTLAMRLT